MKRGIGEKTAISSAIPTNFTKQRAGKIIVGMSIPPAFGGTKLANDSWMGTSIREMVLLPFLKLDSPQNPEKGQKASNEITEEFSKQFQNFLRF